MSKINPSGDKELSPKDFVQHPEVVACLETLKLKFGPNFEKLLVSDTLDDQGKASKSTVTVGKDVLEIANAADPTQVVVLKRAK